jgi:FkbM family methyltransferase
MLKYGSFMRITRSLWSFIKTSIVILIKTKSFRKVINLQFSDENKVVLGLGMFDYIVTKNGEKYYVSRFIDCVRQAQEDYLFDDIKKDDIVIDIGANIGGFSIPASKKARHVYAIEPITTEMLKENILLNKAENITVLEIALGNGSVKKIEWGGRSKIIETKTLAEIKNICGGCDFIKIDCEGGEWEIKAEELEGIRRIEMEVHKVGFSLSLMEERLKQAGFDYKIEIQPDANIGLWTIHARRNCGQ